MWVKGTLWSKLEYLYQWLWINRVKSNKKYSISTCWYRIYIRIICLWPGYTSIFWSMYKQFGDYTKNQERKQHYSIMDTLRQFFFCLCLCHSYIHCRHAISMGLYVFYSGSKKWRFQCGLCFELLWAVQLWGLWADILCVASLQGGSPADMSKIWIHWSL